MRYYPVNLDIAGRTALVVGGGQVALRKARSLKACGALVTVVSPEFVRAFARLSGVTLVKRRYRSGDVRGACLVVGATNSPEVNQVIWKDAARLGVPVNIVDCPKLCTFTVPAIMTRGRLMLTISTGGASPAISRRVREELEKAVSPSLVRHLDLMAAMRPKVLASGLPERDRMKLLKAMAAPAITSMISRKGVSATLRHLRGMLECHGR